MCSYFFMGVFVQIEPVNLRRIFRTCLTLLLSLFAGALYAASTNYTLPAKLGTGAFATCSLTSGSTYGCTSSVNLGTQDTVTLAGPMTLNITGDFTVGNNVTINNSGFLFSIYASNNVSIGTQFTGTVNLQAGNAVSVGNNSVVTGNVKSTSLTPITTGSGTVVNGTCTPSNANCSGQFQLTQVASSNNIPANSNFTFTLTATNTTNATINAVTVTDNLNAANLLFVACNPTTGTCANSSGLVTWTVGNLAPGATATTSITVRSTSAGTLTNSAVSNVGTPAVYARATVQIYSPLADWHMDEASWNGTAGEVKDSSGNGYHGKAAIANGSTLKPTTASTAPLAYSSGIQSTCNYGQFDSTSAPVRTYGYVELSGIPALPTSFTFTAWIRSTAPNQSGQRILVRDDAQNGWGFSLGDAGSQRIRFFNRNIQNSGTVTGDGVNPNCGVFCLDTAAVITANNWFFVAVTIDTVGKVITHYVFDASGALKSNTTSAFTGTWKDGTGLASIGGETAASGEGTQSSFHFKGNIDEVQIYNGVLAQSDLALLLTRTRSSCSTTVDHVEMVSNGSGLTCTPTPVTVLVCSTSASCNGVPANQSATSVSFTASATNGAKLCTDSTCNFPISGTVTVANGTTLYLSGPTVGTTRISGTVSAGIATNSALQCVNSNSGLFNNSTACDVGFVASGFLLSVPDQLSCQGQTATIQAVQASTTSNTCVPAFSNVTRDVKLYSSYTNPTSGSRNASFSYVTNAGGAVSAVTSLSTSALLPTTLTGLYFDGTGTATLKNFSYPDAGKLTLNASYAGSAATNDSGLSLAAVSGNTFIAAPAAFVFSGIPASPLTAGRPFNVTVSAYNACSTPAITPNFGNEVSQAPPSNTVTLTSGNPLPGVGNSGPSAVNTTISNFASGVKSTNLTWNEVGSFDLTARLANYLGSALSPSSTQTITRFKPDHFDTDVASPGCTSFTYYGQPMGIAVTAKSASGNTTANYAGNTWAKAVTLSDANGGTGTWGGNTIQASSFVSGTGVANSATYAFSSKEMAPSSVKVRAAEPVGMDGVSSSSGSETTTTMVSGRVKLINAYGSEKLALPLSANIQHYEASGWQSSSAGTYLDTCTRLAAGNFGFTTAAPGCLTPVASCITSLAISASGVGPPYLSPWNSTLQKPTSTGAMCVTLNLDGTAPGKQCTSAGSPGATATSANMPWLTYPWRGAGAVNPSAAATFGLYKSPLLYLRENY